MRQRFNIPMTIILVMDFADPHYVWYGCLVVGLAAAVAFLKLEGVRRRAGSAGLDDALAA